MPAPLLPPAVQPIPAVVFFSQPNPYDVWRYTAPDRLGYFRPRVILGSTPYYAYNGAPYPFSVERPLRQSPAVLGPVYPLGPVPSYPPRPWR
jgi:hypothetical protein